MPNYHRWVDRMQVIERKIRPSSVYLLLLILVAFFTGVLTWDIWSSQHQVIANPSNAREAELSQALKAQAEVLASRNLELSLEREANNNMQQMFLEQHQKQKELDRELAFYRSIMAPEHQADGVAIHELEMSPSLLTNQYRVKLVLTQLQKRKQALKGKADLLFIGLQQGKVAKLSLGDLTEDKFNFSFRYFQSLETVVQFPDGFELSRVEAKVTVPSSRWSKGASAEQAFTVQELLNRTESILEEVGGDEVNENALKQGLAPSQDDIIAPESDATSPQALPENHDDESASSLISPEPRLLLEQNGQVSDNSAQQTDVRGSND
ncbi:hypothetical protein K0I73_14175 [Shewanella mesophila]|uniref:DUF6776 family protein n=1 Tax=Shewanella mesophila TaxID=2864208 RepID=UPI001C6598D7|nr:DUF6776 family protein [Shewanella mesophila]QYJ85340.1 hypothetical protein K0I73_14175 [Shewanella mesophila]